MDKQTIADLIPIAEMVLASKEYVYYVEYVHRGRWTRSRHLEYICDQIQEFIEHDTGHAIDILVLQMPPQHGKSMSITETLPSWYLGNNPDKRVILASYNDDTAERFTRRNKEKIREYGQRTADLNCFRQLTTG